MHTVSAQHRQDLNQWYKDIKKQLTSKAHENFFKRLQEIISIVNNKLSYLDTKLKIDDTERRMMWNGIANDINSWKGVEITACTKQKTNYKSYAITSRNWWNRNKAKVYGNHFFYPIIFVYIKQSVDRLDITQEEKQYHFVDIFDEILHAKIQFPQTRAQPIIPHQSFIQPNKFKYSAIDLLKTHGTHWNGKNIESNTDDDTSSTNSSSSTACASTVPRQSYYVKDKDRSLKVNNSFMDSLVLLKHKLKQRLVIQQSAVSTFKIKTEPINMLSLKQENKININCNQRLPPSIRRLKRDTDGVNVTNIAAQSLMRNPNLNNNHNPVVVSGSGRDFNFHPSMNISPYLVGNIATTTAAIPDINRMNIVNNVNNNNVTGTAFSFHPVIGSNPRSNNIFDIPSLFNSLNNGSPSSQSSVSPINDPLLNGLVLPNVTNISNYGATRGQSNIVSNQRYSPLNITTMNSSYCSIRTDPISGQLMLSLHIPLN